MNVAQSIRWPQLEYRGHFIQSFLAEKPRNTAFDAFLYAAHLSDLDVSRVCRGSGYIWLSGEDLSPAYLHRYCAYPFNDPFTHKPIDTFMGWNARSLKSGYGPVLGTVHLTALITPRNGLSSLTIKSKWAARNEKDIHAVQSAGSFEAELIKKMETAYTKY